MHDPTGIPEYRVPLLPSPVNPNPIRGAHPGIRWHARWMVRWPLALAFIVPLLVAACGGSGGTSHELAGTYTATIRASGEPSSTSSLILRADRTFDFPGDRSRNGKIYVSGNWTESNGVVTLNCSS